MEKERVGAIPKINWMHNDAQKTKKCANKIVAYLHNKDKMVIEWGKKLYLYNVSMKLMICTFMKVV